MCQEYSEKVPQFQEIVKRCGTRRFLVCPTECSCEGWLGSGPSCDGSPSLINAACEDWSSVKDASRLFDNEKLSSEKILSSHFRRTVDRMGEYLRVFAIQGTTYLDYTDHPSTQGLGSIGTKSQNLSGFVKHTTLIFTQVACCGSASCVGGGDEPA